MRKVCVFKALVKIAPATAGANAIGFRQMLGKAANRV
jgi:hypothetical protein